MPRRKTRKKPVKATESVVPDLNDPQIQTHHHHHPQFIDHEIEAMERQIGAIRAVRDVKVEHLLTELRLLRSRFSEEQLQKPLLEVFEETLPNLSIVNDEGRNKFEVAWRGKGSVAYPRCAANVSHLGAFEFSTIVLKEPSKTQTLAVQEGLQHPDVNSQKFPVGMTHKTLRLPKLGEMLLSVHGSPLGVYKENNMEAIHESEEG